MSLPLKSGAIIACRLDGKGGIAPSNAPNTPSADLPYWLHLNCALAESRRWLEETPLISNPVREALSQDSMRPRISKLSNGLILVLRGIDKDEATRPEPLLAIRIFITQELIISTRKRKVDLIDELHADLKNQQGVTNAGSWLVRLVEGLTEDNSEFISIIHDQILEMEDNLLSGQSPARGDLARLRKQLIVMRRYMAPQRDVFSRIVTDKPTWMSDEACRRMSDMAERMGRGLEDLDAGIARTAILNDEINAQVAESMNRRTYFMSLLAMIFLPATFLTGLFGVNLGGIPGGNWHYGFTIFCLALLTLAIVIAVILHRRHWL